MGSSVLHRCASAAVLLVGASTVAFAASACDEEEARLTGVFVAHASLGEGSEDPDAGLRVYDAETGDVIFESRNEGRPWIVPRFSPAGDRLAAVRAGDDASSTRVVTLALPSGEMFESEPLEVTPDLGEPIWSPDGTRFAMAGQRLTVFTAGAEILGASDIAPALPNGSHTLGRPRWSPDSQRVAVVLSGSLILADRDGGVVRMDRATLDEAPVIGAEYDAERDDITHGPWLDDEHFSIVILRDRFVPPGDDGPSRPDPRFILVEATIDGLEVRWGDPAPITPEEFVLMQSPTSDEADQIVAKAVSLVPDADERLADGLRPWHTADGGDWVVAVPRSVENKNFTTVVIMVEPPVLLELLDAVLGFPDHARPIDVVVAD
jgi:hypothetical protein